MRSAFKVKVFNSRNQFKDYFKWFLFYFLVSILLGTIFNLQVVIDRLKTTELKEKEFIYLPYNKNFGNFTLGFNEILSDILYIKAINYFGKHYLSDKDYPYLYKMLDAATDLSPNFKDPYEFGAVILTFEADEVKKSVALLDKAILNNPDYWRFPFYLSFNYFFYLDDFEKAALYMKKASFLDGAPPYLSKLTARLYTHSGRPELALDFLSRMRENIKDENARCRIELKIKEVLIEKDIQDLEKALRLYKKRYSKMPSKLEELENEGLINKVPIEPFEGHYYINDAGEILSSTHPERLRLHLN